MNKGLFIKIDHSITGRNWM